jgi:hypothetical protein
MGAPVDLPLPLPVQRDIQQVFLWDETTTHRDKELFMMLLNMVFEM